MNKEFISLQNEIRIRKVGYTKKLGSLTFTLLCNLMIEKGNGIKSLWNCNGFFPLTIGRIHTTIL